MAYSRTRIAELCRTASDARTLRLGVIEELRRGVGFEAYAWLLTDPKTSVGAAPLADIPEQLLAELPRVIGLKYTTPVNRWTTLDASAVGLPTDERDRGRFWREALRPHGIVDVASMVFRDAYGCWGFLDLWRASAFAASELNVLSGLIEPVTTALRRCQAGTFVAGASSDERGGPVVLLLSADLEVVGQTAPTQAYLQRLLPSDDARAPIPAGAYNVAAQLLAVEAGVDANPPWARVHLADGLWLSLRAARLSPAASGTIAVTIEEASPAERLAVFACAHGLSARESELLTQLATGADTREVAGRMYVSEHTVQDHLKSIFAKTETRTRRKLLSRALGS